MEGAVETIFDVLRGVEQFEERLLRFAVSIKEKREVLTKLLCKNAGIDAPPPSGPPPPQVMSEVAPAEMVSAVKDLQKVADATFSTLTKTTHTHLDEMMRACFHMDLSPLFSSEVRRVIRSFIPTDAETLGKAVESFATGGETQTERDDLLLLLKVGADIDGLHEGKNALTRAVYAGSLQAVEILVEAGADPVTKGGEEMFKGYTALHRACYERRADIVRFLVSQGANVNAEEMFKGYTALHRACYERRADIFRFLVSQGANVNAEEMFKGYTALHRACYERRTDIVRFLVSQGANVNAEEMFKGYTALHRACYERCADIVRFLVSQGANVNAEEMFKGYTALHRACYERRADIVRFLVSQGANVNAEEMFKGYTALHRACYERRADIVRFLVSQGANVNAEEMFKGYTALHRACYERRADIVRFLVSQGANVNAKDDQQACAVYKGSMEIVDFLLEKGADLKTRNLRGYSLLHEAALGNHSEMAEMLIDRGLEVNARDDHQISPLQLTRFFLKDGSLCDVDFAVVLIDRGADVNEVNVNGLTMAMRAAGAAAVNLLKLVVDRGADVHAIDGGGRTALHYAAGWPMQYSGTRVSELQILHQRKRETAEFLVARGINVLAMEAGTRRTAAQFSEAQGFPPDSPLRVFLDSLGVEAVEAVSSRGSG
uniref:Uncharacterized protein n=1 Tax=Chromera velia CCMP2878 TaxID=1169474 RepID=A0A0G4HI30_9ALVE|eukprot:Cvel_6903.t1-p1 / transcript=Cvel_6903.t1 / gene=Cvel_6903 / organism=Chromera_velia_CCMP2878 / gene_product=Putative ankyrin repeat protein RF_0381, putative / transcript_product=Putative ankyrin repeat protein RF_0381, putative / location=Cvel_scaffold349:46677-48665(-) / protein_length=663 / sequence_SO=supercontig / SO=protein_coding / is_pseudo=false